MEVDATILHSFVLVVQGVPNIHLVVRALVIGRRILVDVEMLRTGADAIDLLLTQAIRVFRRAGD